MDSNAPHRLPLSDTADLITENGQETPLSIAELGARLGVDALIRLHQRDFDLLGRDRKSLVHFNLEYTTNEVGKRYAVVPIIRPGRREPDGSEVLPVLDLSVARRGVCTKVIQQLPLDQVTAAQFAASLSNIRNPEELGAALLRRYELMFPSYSAADLLSRGCALTGLTFVDT